MDFFNQILTTINFILNFFSSIHVFIIILILIFIYQILLIYVRDKKYVEAFNSHKDPEISSRDNLDEFPLVNIIVPAWNESERFRECLLSITKLKYPKIKAIINAGGSDETLNIANSFKNNKNFIILNQKGGGKIKALNECLPHVTEGILYLVDADVYFTDEIIIRMVYPIVNTIEDVVVGRIRPLKAQENKDLVKYLLINRNLYFRVKFTRYDTHALSGANTCLKLKVMKDINKFTERKYWAEDKSRGADVLAKGFKIYRLTDYRARLFSEFPNSIRTWLPQRIRWRENHMLYSFKQKKLTILKFIVVFLISLYLVLFPILVFLHISLLFFGLFIYSYLYLLKIRRLIFFKKTTNEEFLQKYTVLFYLKLILYSYIEILTNIIVFFDLLLFRKNYKRRKNLLTFEEI